MEEVIRILICGSVDDGKSTLLGKLMYESNLVYQDQIEEVKNESKKYGTQGSKLDLALLSDGLQAEREQGITIDVAYKYFFLKKKKFIIADTPGHVEYTRNLATGASNSEFAIILVDATKGVLPHTKLCTIISSLFRLQKILVVINKMDLVRFDRNIFENIKKDYLKFLNQFNYRNIDFIPVSALNGDNILKKSKKMQWYNGLSLINKIELFKTDFKDKQDELRLGIQLVNRNSSNRLYCGHIFSGEMKIKDKVAISSSNEINEIKKIFSSKGNVKKAKSNSYVSLLLKNNTDISRGSFLSSIKNPVKTFNAFNAYIIWLNKKSLHENQKIKIKFILNDCEAKLDYISYKFVSKKFEKIKSDKLELNEIGLCKVSLSHKLPLEKYAYNKKIGSFIVIDIISNQTVGAGVIEDLHDEKYKEIFWQDTHNNQDQNNFVSQEPLVLWFTGLSASGKSTIANLVHKKLNNFGKKSYLLDGDNLRHGLCNDLSFSNSDRKENIRRASELSKIISNMGYIVLACFVSPFRNERLTAKKIVDQSRFLEIFCSASVSICEKRDKKGLYKKARKGILRNFTGINSVYEKPLNPDITLDSNNKNPIQLSEQVIQYLKKNNFI